MKGKIISITSACTVLCAGAVAVALYANTFGSDSTPTTQAAVDISPDINIYEEIPTESIAETKIAKTEIRELAKTVDPREATKDDIYHMMLNTIDYFDKASGTFYYPAGIDNNVICTVDFQTELSTGSSFYHIYEGYIDNNSSEMFTNISSDMIATEKLRNEEFYCGNGDALRINKLERSYKPCSDEIITIDQVEEIPDNERIMIAEDGEPCYYYRNDPTNIEASSMCLRPQEMTFGFLSN